MQQAESGQKCPECAGVVIDAGDELACSSCGMVTQKEVLDVPKGGPIQAIDFTGQSLGGYLGSAESRGGAKYSEGLSGANSSYRYMKLVSDYAGREDSAYYSCAKTIERVCDYLELPRILVGEAVLIARRLYAGPLRGKATSGAVSAFAIVNACKVMGAAPVGVREVLEAHRAMGRRVKMSDLIQLSLVVPIQATPRRPEDCIPRILAKVSEDPRLGKSLSALSVKTVPYVGVLRNGALEALGRVSDVEKAGHNPWALAATAVYSAEVLRSRKEGGRPRISQKDVARASRVAEYTIREQYSRIFRGATGSTGSAASGRTNPPST